ncbi:hypothetical protein V6Z11_D03G103200 [Gossypium hirsutum]
MELLRGKMKLERETFNNGADLPRSCYDSYEASHHPMIL